MTRIVTILIALGVIILPQVGCSRLRQRIAARRHSTRQAHHASTAPVATDGGVEAAGFEAPASETEDSVELPPLRVNPPSTPRTAARFGVTASSGDDPYRFWNTRMQPASRGGCAAGGG